MDRSLLATSVTKSDAPKKGGHRIYTFRANDGDFDRYNDRNKVTGWKLANYNANPIILFNHNDGSGSNSHVLPIGKGRAYLNADKSALMVDIEFDEDDDFARQVESKVAKGIISAVSVRYRLTPGKFWENSKGGIDSEEQELLEISIVNIPGNQRAVRVKKVDAELANAVAKAVVTELRAARATPAKTSTHEISSLDAAGLATAIQKHLDAHRIADRVREYLAAARID